MLLWPFGVLLAVSSVAGMAMSLAVLSTRFRDVPPIVGAIVTVAFYVTPVIWMAENLGDNQLAHLLLGLNPFYHLLQVSRLPMLGQLPTLENWALAAASAVIFWVMGMLILKKYQHKIPYWV
jgi:lipopolysaccharide transport system permease protein